MGDVKSKNLYELLGNDHDQDSDKEPEPPTKTVDKTAPRIGKRDVAKEAPGAAAGGAGGQRRDGEQRTGGFTQENRRFRDRTNNSKNPNPTENRNRDLDTRGAEGVPGRDSGPGARRARGGPRRGGDRHSRTGRGDHAKQVDQGWGGQTGEAEESIEKAGEADAQQDKKEEITENAGIPEEPIPEPEPEPEDTSVSYTDYLKQQAEKKMADLGLKEARKPNEGAKENKTWATKEVSSDKQGESYFEGQQKASRQRERETKKQVLDIDYSFKEPQRESGTRGGRGDRGSRGDRRGGRGDRGEGRGEYRGGRGRGDFQSRGDRGDRAPRGDRGSYRGGRGGQSNQNDQPAISDSSAFPALGGN